VTIDGVAYGPVRAVLEKDAGGSNHWITVSLDEGKNREVRKLLEHVGLKVNRLIRLSYGPFELGDLVPGEVEELSPRQVREHLKALIAPESLPQGAGRGKRFRPPRPVRGAARPAKGEGAPAAPARTPAAAPEKKAYKAGWARPKRKPRPAASARPQRRSGAKPKGRK
jgi:23S rRNA pseudouridine2605 synthase